MIIEIYPPQSLCIGIYSSAQDRMSDYFRPPCLFAYEAAMSHLDAVGASAPPTLTLCAKGHKGVSERTRSHQLKT